MDGYPGLMSPRVWSAVPDQAKRLWQQVFKEQPEDALPREWIAGALVLSIGALALGLWLDSSALLQSELATLALLGPGLLLTNVVAVQLKNRRRSAQRKSRIAATVTSLISNALLFWPPIFNAFDQLGIRQWAEGWHDKRTALIAALDAEPRTALTDLAEVMEQTSSSVRYLTRDLGPKELLNIGDTPPPTQLLYAWQSIIAALNQDVMVPAGLARLNTSIAQQQAMRIQARTNGHSLTLSPSDPSLRDNYVTAHSYGAMVGVLADSASTVVTELMIDLGWSDRRDPW